MTRELAAARQREELDAVYPWVLGDWTLDVESVRHDPATGVLSVPLRRQHRATGLLELPAGVDWSPGQPLHVVLRISDTVSVRVHDPERVRIYEVENLAFDDAEGAWTLEALPHLTIEARVTRLRVDVVLATGQE
jgi:hypothetical protein